MQQITVWNFLKRPFKCDLLQNSAWPLHKEYDIFSEIILNNFYRVMSFYLITITRSIANRFWESLEGYTNFEVLLNDTTDFPF